MNHADLMNTVRWQQIRWLIYDRDGGCCKICGRPGNDTHHLTYKFGFFEPRAIILVCRPCHLIWQGEDPEHLPPDHTLRPKLFQIAAIARSLGRTTHDFGAKVLRPLPEWAHQMVPAVHALYVAGVKQLLAESCTPSISQ